MENEVINEFSLDSLNDQQKQAVLHTKGPLRLIAGAGSGKTRVLTYKIAHLIKNMNISPSKILAVTFSNKAANEMRERALDMIDNTYEKPVISTFHALCSKILRREISNINYPNDFQILDELDQKQILRLIYGKLGIDSQEYSASSVLSYIDNAKNLLKTPAQAIEEAEEEQKILNKKHSEKDLRPYIYEEYENHLKNTHSLDFTDLLVYTRQIFYDPQHKKIREKWENMFDYILVDEFQDTSQIQYDIVKVLAKNQNITIVGDPDQTIYTWRNADINIIVNFDKDFSNVETIKLEQNYRSSKKIIEAANKLISKNILRVEKRLFTENEEGENIEFYCGFSDEAEARWIAAKIGELKRKRVQLKNIAILYRTNSYSRAIEEALMFENTNHKVFGSIRFYQREEIKDALAYLRVIHDGSEISLLRIINKPSRKIGSETIQKLLTYASKYNEDLWTTLESRFVELQKITGINRSTLENIANLINAIRWSRRRIQTTGISKVLYELIYHKINYFGSLKLTEDELENKIENFKSLIAAIENWEHKNPNSGIDEYLQEITLITDRDPEDDVSSYVSLMTVHNAKGLEYDYVFIAGLAENIFPHYRSIAPQGEKPSMFSKPKANATLANPELLEEERRLAYVAITRAKKKLFVSFSTSKHNEESRFIQEAGVRGTGRLIGIANSFSIADDINENIKIIAGDKIVHSKFGKGVVLSSMGDVIEVKFDIDGSQRMLSKSQAPIKKYIDEDDD
ncbi:ATP-dependent helicase [Mycoplasma zalophi]|uniref:ATP-dependent helicase n=1 Tax=Mycoplasma zalophi TaxID=191287 RepID=UPI001C11291B|nr:UvrD-helicase domain-containing protein [Mycoplasma zalophi]MBU4691101.1 ATP-dependent helicase [Mycoplasma zalophi]